MSTHPLYLPNDPKGPHSPSLRESVEALYAHFAGVCVTPPSPQEWRMALNQKQEQTLINLFQSADAHRRDMDFQAMYHYSMKMGRLSPKGLKRVIDDVFSTTTNPNPIRAFLINHHPDVIGNDRLAHFFTTVAWMGEGFMDIVLVVNPKEEWVGSIKRVLVHVLENETIPWRQKIQYCRQLKHRGWNVNHAGVLNYQNLISGIPHALLCRFRPAPELSDLRELLQAGLSFDAKDKNNKTVEEGLDNLCEIFEKQSHSVPSYRQYAHTRSLKEDLLLHDDLEQRLDSSHASQKRKI